MEVLHYLPNKSLCSIIQKAVKQNSNIAYAITDAIVDAIYKEVEQFSQWQLNGSFLDVLPGTINYLYIGERLTSMQICKSWQEIINKPYCWTGELYAAEISPQWIKVKAKYYKLFTNIEKLVVSEGHCIDIASFLSLKEFENFHNGMSCGLGDLPEIIYIQFTRLLFNDTFTIPKSGNTFTNLTILSCFWYISLQYYDYQQRESKKYNLTQSLFPQLKLLTWAFNEEDDGRDIYWEKFNNINEFWQNSCPTLTSLNIQCNFYNFHRDFYFIVEIDDMFPFLSELIIDHSTIKNIRPENLSVSLTSITADFRCVETTDYNYENESPFEIFIKKLRHLSSLNQLVISIDLEQLCYLSSMVINRVTHCYINGSNYRHNKEPYIKFVPDLILKELVVTWEIFLILLEIYNNHKYLASDKFIVDHLIILPTELDHMQNYCPRLPTLHKNYNIKKDCLQSLQKFNRCTLKKLTGLKLFPLIVSSITGSLAFYEKQPNKNNMIKNIFENIITKVTTCNKSNILYDKNADIAKYRNYVASPHCIKR